MDCQKKCKCWYDDVRFPGTFRGIYNPCIGYSTGDFVVDAIPPIFLYLSLTGGCRDKNRNPIPQNRRSDENWAIIHLGVRNSAELRTDNYLTPGTIIWQAPLNLVPGSVSLTMSGGGGGGSGALNNAFNGGGGSGGFYRHIGIPILPGDFVTITVGAGGQAGNGSNGNNGGTTSISWSNSQIFAGGGGGGTFNPSAGGAGGGVDTSNSASANLSSPGTLSSNFGFLTPFSTTTGEDAVPGDPVDGIQAITGAGGGIPSINGGSFSPFLGGMSGPGFSGGAAGFKSAGSDPTNLSLPPNTGAGGMGGDPLDIPPSSGSSGFLSLSYTLS